MLRLTGSVGKGGNNSYEDVRVVQQALNDYAVLLGAARVREDGTLDDATAAAILEFQRRIVRIDAPDGRVDPASRTLRTLLAESPQGATLAYAELPNDGPGYYLHVSRDHAWGRPSTLRSIVALGARLVRHELVVGVGDVSLSHGSHLPPHEGHRHGVEVDLRPQRLDRARLEVAISDPDYDREATALVVKELFVDENVASVVFNDRHIHGVRFREGHEGHLHVVFRD
ncbi:MAG TPA: peptidoglycan-binding domain-containing protein [Byssovorax sp.]|jgi:hypothetical protein